MGQLLRLSRLSKQLFRSIEADVINQVIERSTCQTAVAPQTFALSKIHSLHLKAQAENQFDMTDSATLARYFWSPSAYSHGGQRKYQNYDSI